MSYPPDMPSEERRGLAVASLVIGLASLLLSTLLVGGLVALAGIACGVLHLATRRGGAVMASFGIALSVAAIPAAVGLGVLYYRMFTALSETMQSQFDLAKDFSYWEGVRAPDFSVTTSDGATFNLSDHAGQFVIAHVAKAYGPENAKHLRNWNDALPLVEGGSPASILLTDTDSSASRSMTATYGVDCPIANGTSLKGLYCEMLDEEFLLKPITIVIDRNGAIKRVINYRTQETAQSLADLLNSGDYEGEVLEELPATKEGITEADPQWTREEVWSVELGVRGALITGDADNDGNDEVLLAGDDQQLRIIGSDGSERQSVPLPDDYDRIAVGKGPDGVRYLAARGESLDLDDA